MAKNKNNAQDSTQNAAGANKTNSGKNAKGAAGATDSTRTNADQGTQDCR